MFCPQCGTKNPEGAKFCVNCGSKIPEITLQESSVQASDEGCGLNVAVKETTSIQSLDTAFIGRLYMDFYGMAWHSSNNYVSELDSRYETLDTFVLNAEKDITALYRSADDYILNLLHQQGVYQFAEKQISSYTEKYIGFWIEVFNEALQAYQNITGEEQQMRAYRTMRKDARGKVIGGGFGVSGAVKGMATAGAINMTTGLLHSFANAIGNARSAAEADSQKAAFFRNSQFRSGLQSAIEADIMSMLQGVCEIWDVLGLGKIPYYSTELLEQAVNIGNSVLEGKVPSEQVEVTLFQMLSICPVYLQLYILAANLLPEKAEIFYVMAERYGLNPQKYLSESNAQANKYAKRLIQNTIFDAAYKYLDADLSATINLIANCFEDDLDTVFAVLSDDAQKKCASTLTKMHDTFAPYGYTETPILFLNSASIGNNRGVVLTNQRLYVHSNRSGEKPCSFALEDVDCLNMIVNADDSAHPLYSLQINEEIETTVFRLTKGLKYIVAIMDFFISYCLYLEATSMQSNNDFLSGVLKHANISLQEFESYALDCAEGSDDDDDEDGNDEEFLELDEGERDDPKNKEAPVSDASVKLSDVMPPHDADSIIAYIEQHTFKTLQKSDIYNEYFHSCRSPIPNSRRPQFGKFKDIYRQALNSGELFLFYYDNTMIRNAKESFLLTDKGIHFSSTRYPSGMLRYQDIKSLEIKTVKMFPNLIINETITIPIRFMFDECYDFMDDLRNDVIPILLRLQ